MTDSNRRTATCHCGQLRITLAGEPALVSMCHCLACQQRTGSPFGVTAFFERKVIVARSGEDTSYRRVAESGRAVVSHFCPRCGSTLFWEPEMFPDRIGVAAGAFADPSFPAPHRAVWTHSKHHWVELPAGIPHYDGPAVPPTPQTSGTR